ncbi:unnamed protein product [Spirodela intermedia]|uniref:FLZ-type domain-containing protein n=1 Tax=Spirodela intermedia TaxID=51605 RepID=A0A7I8JJY1_SPIIN|nr:unnamed protein product [Spirodela intermedia]CAA6669742.1 unnamed protein product [Spirodela intermedia]
MLPFVEEDREPRGLDSHGGVTFSVEAPCEEEPRRLLDACFLCRGPLRGSSDVFIGDTPFCSEDCRQEQIGLDDARDRQLRYRRKSRHRRSAAAEQPSPSADAQSLHAKAAEAVAAG